MSPERLSHQPTGKIEDLPASATERRKGAITVLGARLRLNGALLSTEVQEIFTEHDLAVVPPAGLVQRYMRETAQGTSVVVLRRNGVRVYVDISRPREEIDWESVDKKIEDVKMARAMRRQAVKAMKFIPDS